MRTDTSLHHEVDRAWQNQQLLPNYGGESSRRMPTITIPTFLRYAAACILLLATSITHAREVLTTCVAVRSLPPEEASKFWAVNLQGRVITRMFGTERKFVLQDETGCISVELGNHRQQEKRVSLQDLKPGTAVTVKGSTIWSEDGPRIRLNHLEKRSGTELPPPTLLEAEEVENGKYEDRYIEFNAVVRSHRLEEDSEGKSLILGFGPNNRQLEARIWLPVDREVPAVKTDDLVRVRGMALTPNKAGQSSSITTIAADIATGFDLLFDAPEDLSQIPETPISVILTQSHDPFTERRRRISGVVTLFWPGKLVVIQNEAHAVRILPPADLKISPGMRASVAGIPTLYEDGLLMEQTVFFNVSPGQMPGPEPVLRREMTADPHQSDRDGLYVALGGVVAGIDQKGDEQLISVESEQGIFRCLLPNSEPLPAGLETGAYVEVSGVCRFIYEWKMGTKSKDLEILLPNATSLKVRTVPSWWTPWRVGLVLLLSSATMAGLGAWGFFLRRKVQMRTRLLAREINSRRESELISEERSRLALELHDGISQLLSAAALQLEAAAKSQIPDDKRDERLVLAKRLLDHGREDLRRAVWDLSPGSLEKLGFKGALDKIAAEVSRPGLPAIKIQTQGAVDTLPPRLHSHIFRLIQEAVSNAAAHSGGASIHVNVTAEKDDSHRHRPRRRLRFQSCLRSRTGRRPLWPLFHADKSRYA